MRNRALLAATTVFLSLISVMVVGSPTASAETILPPSCATQEALVGVSRTAGADRYEVSAELSSDMFPPGTSVAFIASGSNFADALSGSAAAGYLGGPVLLVDKGDEAPLAVRTELNRLKPGRIVVLGGPASVSTALEQTMRQFAPSVSRVSGADRFEVSAALAAQTFGTLPETIYVASGEVFPDALSASPAAGTVSAPVVLVRKDDIPASIERYLESAEGLKQIVIVGGPSTVSSSVADSLSRFARVEREQGADRFEVSAATSAHRFCSDRAMVFIASGEVFPDALSGASLAIQWGAPVLLVSHDTIPFAVKQELRRLNPQHITVLGGEKTISKSVELKLADYLWK